MRLYIVNPDCGVPIHFEADVLRLAGSRPAAFVASLALPTLAALAPRDWRVEVCDERIQGVDLEHPAEHVWITCNSRQYGRMRALAGEFRRRGKTVAVGGVFATLSPEAVRPFCDILVRGELEPVAPEVFAALREGKWKEEYLGAPADLESAPLPRWDLYPNDWAMAAAVQTSRGCPNDCGFCEVIQYYGRKPRFKPVARVLAELDAVYGLGYRMVFLTDDNLAASPGRAKELLDAVAGWNRERGVQFLAQMSVADARDEELLALCARAGLSHAYIGVESPDRASLEEAGKSPNLGADLAAGLRTFQSAGINVIASMIVGFDADGPDAFARHERFLAGVPVASAQVGPLVLTRGTRLHDRLQAERRLSWDGLASGLPWITNVRPRLMSREALLAGLGDLSRRLYAPAAFTDRLAGFWARMGRWPACAEGAGHAAVGDAWKLVDDELARDPGLVGLAALVRGALAERPASAAWLRVQVFQYLQSRRVYGA
ncbi:MAG: radical SAM protein [Elusimicrobia bacterium]|nr:radical SAM protein [Elusimicrobiota bacterium]